MSDYIVGATTYSETPLRMTTDANKFLSADGTTKAVQEAALSTSDNTTANVSTTKHGFMPKMDKIYWDNTNGAIWVRYKNKTGGNSVKGTIVQMSDGTANAVMTAPADSQYPIGIIVENGIADGSDVWVCIMGRCQVLMKDSTALTLGTGYLYVSNVAGRADVGTSASAVEHMREIGHHEESSAGGTDVLIWATVHWN